MLICTRNLSSAKLICINEYRTISLSMGNISNIQSKLDWLAQFCDFINNKNIKMASYFNKVKETDWPSFGVLHGDIVWHNYSTYSAYRLFTIE